jgi:hypothetical protein
MLNTIGIGATIADAVALALGHDVRASATALLDLQHRLYSHTRVEERLRSSMHGTAFVAALAGEGAAADDLYGYLRANGISIPWQVALFRRGQQLRGATEPAHDPIQFGRASDVELAALRRMQGSGADSSEHEHAAS